MVTISKMQEKDAQEILGMMRDFYASPAIIHDVPQEVLKRDVEACVGDNPYLEGIVFQADGVIAGYAMLAKSFSTEFGGACIWIEDLYMKPEYRGSGIGTQFFQYLEEQYQGKAVLLKLEVERENVSAMKVYQKCGYQELPYMEMIKEL